MSRWIVSLALLSVAAVAPGCGDDHGTDHATDAGHAGHTDTGDARDTGAPTDAGAPADAPAGPPASLNDCTPSDYDDRSGDMAERTIAPRGSTGYTPRCVIVRVGQSVTFAMDFSTHPLVPGVPHGPRTGATSPNLIPPQRTGTQAMVTFTAAGNYPFYCDVHGHVGMAGVVRVVP